MDVITCPFSDLSVGLGDLCLLKKEAQDITHKDQMIYMTCR